MFRKALIMSLALLLAQTASVHAGAVLTFDPDGGGVTAPITDLTGLDWVVGNALADLGNLAAGVFMGSATETVLPDGSKYYSGGQQIPFNLFFQSKINDVDGTLMRVGPDSKAVPGTEITIAVGLQEVVTSIFVDPKGAVTASFGLAPVQTNNFLELWFDNLTNSDPGILDPMSASAANDLEGTGFNDGIPILTAMVTEVPTSYFKIPDLNARADLDIAGDDNYDGPGGNAGPTTHDGSTPAIDTVVGEGATNLKALVTWADQDFWILPSDVILNLTLFDTTQALPYDLVDPSAKWVKGPGGAQPVVDGAGDPTGVSLGPVNGDLTGQQLGDDVQFEADGNQSFTVTPEPTSCALWLLAAGGVVLTSRMRRRRHVA
jgi:hypothetical protein